MLKQRITMEYVASPIDEKATAALSASLRGELIRPGDLGYDAARRVYNAMIDKYPALIARCADTADVMATVNFARENGLLVAVRGGGHSGAGFGTCDHGLVIDLSPMRSCWVHPGTGTVQVQAGAVWGDVDHATHPFGLAVPGGVVSSTGVAGLTLGGGHGYLTRKYGLTIDNLLAADVVLADGSFVTASADENEDLFWALRGGGGNFGVVTSFVFQAHPVDTVYAGPILWPLEQAAEAMQFYREFMAAAPDDIYGFFAFLVVPPVPPFPQHLHMQTMCGIIWCYTGELDDAEEALRPAREFGPPVLDLAGPIPFPMLQGMFDALLPPGLQWYWTGDFVKELSDEAIALHVRHGSQVPTLQSTMHLYPIDGAANRVAQDATAFSYRDAKWSTVYCGVDTAPNNSEHIAAWTKEYWEALHPYSAGGAYVNFLMEEGQERIQSTYRGNYNRLVEMKTKYDPNNLFRLNQNIRPRGAPSGFNG